MQLIVRYGASASDATVLPLPDTPTHGHDCAIRVRDSQPAEYVCGRNCNQRQQFAVADRNHVTLTLAVVVVDKNSSRNTQCPNVGIRTHDGHQLSAIPTVDESVPWHSILGFH